MASGPEKLFTQWLQRIPGWDIQRIETTTCLGVPDCNVAIKGRPGNIWVELKAMQYLKLRKEQYAWGLRRSMSYDDNVYLFNSWNKVITIWKFPFKCKPAGKGHVKPVNNPDWEMSYDYFKDDFNLKTL